jgi:cell division protein FtsN
MLFSQTLIAVAVLVGVTVIWTLAIAVASAIWQRQEIREFMSSHRVTIPAQDSTKAEEAQELVLR